MNLNLCEIESWQSPATKYPRRRIKSAEIKTHWYEKGIYHNYMQRGYEFFRATKRLQITDLQIDGKTWMVDDPPHWWAMEDHANYLHGNVLCAGLGLGLMVHALTPKDNVKHIMVVERNQDVIELVGPHVPHDKLTIINEDFFNIQPDSLPKIDSVLFDLFVGNAHQMVGEAIAVTTNIITHFETNGDKLAIRIHGFMHPHIEQVARTILEHRKIKSPSGS